MDTENFLLKRRALLDRMEARRLANAGGVKLPAWMRWAIRLAPSGGVLGPLIQIGMPLVIPFLFRRQASWFSRLLVRLLPSFRES
jgi:hypothetical protein